MPLIVFATVAQAWGPSARAAFRLVRCLASIITGKSVASVAADTDDLNGLFLAAARFAKGSSLGNILTGEG